jgi:hypothetical protein
MVGIQSYPERDEAILPWMPIVAVIQLLLKSSGPLHIENHQAAKEYDEWGL